MTPDPFIRDAAFKGSPILSYGTANRGSAWPKFLALGAGFFVLAAGILGSWFWFFTSIPIPKQSIIELDLPAGSEMGATSPLIWKQMIELNKPMPTLAGLVKSGNSSEFKEYAIRLSPARAIVGRSSLWQVESQADIAIMEYKSPFEVFGWPWELVNRRANLSVKLREMFSYQGNDIQELPEILSGEIIGNRWKTNLPLKIEGNSLPLDNFSSGGVVFSNNDSDFLANFLQYFGSYSKGDDASLLEWEFAPASLKLDYEGAGDLGAVIEEGDSGVSVQEFVMEDGTAAKRLYLASTTATGSSSEAIEIPSYRYIETAAKQKSVSDLTCDGDALAVFDRQSLRNFCSWFDICYFDFDTVKILNDDDFLTVCGY
ncbi:hypothetical protein GF391_00110 [Candidatus Uhrbacteria bacterium]|nr:hypothetical protein [Candidatus Uhrbacteria bacterium]